jgi:membrane protease YdiL (CAAX protease family)
VVRVQPRAAVSVAVVIAYMVVVTTLWAVNDVDYETVGDSADNIVAGIVMPVGLGAILLAGATTWLGWWRPALFEHPRVGGRWLLAVPILLVASATGTLLSGDLGSLDAGHLSWLAVGVLLVGFSEELLCRGLGLVGFRGSLSEGWAWFSSCLAFGLIHAVNALFGQSAGATGAQIALAFVAGTAFYVIRRSTGVLVWCMLLHAFWDFSSISADASGADEGSAWLVLTPLQYVGYVLAFVGLWRMLRPTSTGSEAPPASQAA